MSDIRPPRKESRNRSYYHKSRFQSGDFMKIELNRSPSSSRNTEGAASFHSAVEITRDSVLKLSVRYGERTYWKLRHKTELGVNQRISDVLQIALRSSFDNSRDLQIVTIIFFTLSCAKLHGNVVDSLKICAKNVKALVIAYRSRHRSQRAYKR